MKSIIIYYSYSGNTRSVAGILKEYLSQKGITDTIELKALDESVNFFSQGARAFKKLRAKIEGIDFDLSGYDLICLGTPVWAFGPAPAMNTCLDNCMGIGSKSIILFTTYGSGAGNNRCLNYMQEILSKKGVTDFKRFSIQQRKIKDREFVFLRIKEVLPL